MQPSSLPLLLGVTEMEEVISIADQRKYFCHFFIPTSGGDISFQICSVGISTMSDEYFCNFHAMYVQVERGISSWIPSVDIRTMCDESSYHSHIFAQTAASEMLWVFCFTGVRFHIYLQQVVWYSVRGYNIHLLQMRVSSHDIFVQNHSVVSTASHFEPLTMWL